MDRKRQTGDSHRCERHNSTAVSVKVPSVLSASEQLKQWFLSTSLAHAVFDKLPYHQVDFGLVWL